MFKENLVNQNLSSAFNVPKISDKEFYKLKEYIEKHTGIKITESKRFLIQARLLKRLKALNLCNFSDYCSYVFQSNDLKEIVNLIDSITTNKTEFFREANHFYYLKNKILPEIFSKKQCINIWSAACSTGEEPYTIAMVVSDFIEKFNLNKSFSVLGSDISTKVLRTAITAIYPYEKINEVPKEYYKYFLKSKNPENKVIRVAPEIRKVVQFKRINLLEDFSFLNSMDIIFCRNVFIYFEKKTQEMIAKKFYSLLEKEGILFIGHSETFQGIETEFKRVAPSVYQKVIL